MYIVACVDETKTYIHELETRLQAMNIFNEMHDLFEKVYIAEVERTNDDKLTPPS